MNSTNSQVPNLSWLYLWIHEQAEELRAKKKNAANSGGLEVHTTAASSSKAQSHYRRKRARKLVKVAS